MKSVNQVILVLVLLVNSTTLFAQRSVPLQIGTFQVDATPPLGSMMAYQTIEGVTSKLWLKGIVIKGKGKPVVLISVDWLGIGGDGYQRFRERVAKEVGTSVDHVAIHSVHQHDAPRFDLSTDEILSSQNLSGQVFDVAFCLGIIQKTAKAARKAFDDRQSITHMGLGQSKVEKVASNRRILSPDRKSVLHTRWTATKDPEVQAFPEGVIDPYVKVVSFFNREKPIAVLSYYATHPQSFYLTKKADSDFPGMARKMSEEHHGQIQIHFNGAGGNITAGKYNNGDPDIRPKLAKRLAKGMKTAFENSQKSKFDVIANDMSWKSVPVVLPLGKHITEEMLRPVLEDPKEKFQKRMFAAKRMGILRRHQAEIPTDITCLSIGRYRMISMPGELFVEYQLAAQKYRPELFITMAAYGDYAFGYIGTEIAYRRTGGYETSDRATAVGPGVEMVLMKAVKELLEE